MGSTDNAQRALCCMQWGHSADVEKRAEDMDVQMLAAEIEKRCFSSSLSPDEIRRNGDVSVQFPLGATFAAAARLTLHAGANVDSAITGEVVEGSLCSILAHSTTVAGGRLLVSSDGGIGWISCFPEGNRRALLNQEWRCGEYLTSLREPLVRSQRLPNRSPPGSRSASPPASRSTGASWEWWQWWGSTPKETAPTK